MRRSMNSHGHGGGPLMTNHLQLHELDLELELLKRKREMIEKQQQYMDNQPFGRSRPFDDYEMSQPQPLFQGMQQYNVKPSYSRYESAPSNGYGGGSLLGKRPMSDQPWRSRSPPRHYSGSQGGAKRKYTSGPSPRSNQSRSAQAPNRHPPQNRPPAVKPQPPKGSKSNFPSQRFNNPNLNKPAQKNFKPTKVGKPKPANPGNKLVSYPTPERTKLVKEAVQVAKDDEVDPNFILRDDKVPSQQLAGRLELALGNILKEIKTKYGNSEAHTVSFQSLFLQRQMKQAIRERLRGVMMGKFVGKVGAIVEHYRRVFPVETDDEIVQAAKGAQQSARTKNLAIKLENAGSAYRYIKHNMNRLVGATLDEMFSKLQEIYVNEENTKDICSKILAEDVPEINIETQGQDNVENESKEFDKSESKDDEISKSVDAVNNENEEKLTAEGTEGNQSAEKEKEDPQNGNDNSETAGKAPAEEGKVAETENTAHADDGDEGKNDHAASKLDSLVLSLLRRRLPYILPKYKTMLLKVLNVSGAYHVTKTAIIEKAKDIQKIDNRVEEAEKKFAENEAISSTPTRPKGNGPYMVKIFGRPALPKRKTMQTFLNEFKPTSVKKHRTMHLLFVSFENKEDFDKIIAIKETTLGNSTIIIKVGEKFAAKPAESLNATAISLNESSGSADISADLNEQINDLLSSIRQEEEEKDELKIEADTPAAVETQATVDTDNNDAKNNVNDDISDVNPSEMNVVTNENTENNKEIANINSEAANGDENDQKVESEESKDRVEELKSEGKETGRATPTRASSRLAATPSSIRTRRASRLANN